MYSTVYITLSRHIYVHLVTLSMHTPMGTGPPEVPGMPPWYPGEPPGYPRCPRACHLPELFFEHACQQACPSKAYPIYPSCTLKIYVRMPMRGYRGCIYWGASTHEHGGYIMRVIFTTAYDVGLAGTRRDRAYFLAAAREKYAFIADPQANLFTKLLLGHGVFRIVYQARLPCQHGMILVC